MEVFRMVGFDLDHKAHPADVVPPPELSLFCYFIKVEEVKLQMVQVQPDGSFSPVGRVFTVPSGIKVHLKPIGCHTRTA